jgi:hypothetical protein
MLTNDKAVEVLPTPATAQTRTTSRHFTSRSTATEAQIERLIELLRLAPRNTHELRRHGVSHPAGRILDLQKRGFLIDSSRVTTVDSDGYSHVGVALYSLISEPDAAQGSTSFRSPVSELLRPAGRAP